jgi:MYXO-CTERM domain-containing protein
MGRRADIGAVDLGGHDTDRIGKFGTTPTETIAPTVMLTSPAAGATVTGTIDLAATAQDNAGGSGVVLVQFLVDGNVVGQTSTSPYTVSFNSAIVSNGDHMFSAKAWDAAGNFGVSAAVTVHVSGNTPPPGPDGGAPHDGGAAGTSGGTGAAGSGGPGAAGNGSGGPGAGGMGGMGGAGGTGGAGGPRPIKGGCGCDVASGAGGPVAAMLLLLAGWAVTRRRRRA